MLCPMSTRSVTGTGHAANCELNYTPMRADGNVDIAKALEVNVEFDLSRQLWAYLIRKGAIATPDSSKERRWTFSLK